MRKFRGTGKNFVNASTSIEHLRLWLYPELRNVPAASRKEVFAEAKQTALDIKEVEVIFTWIALVALLSISVTFHYFQAESTKILLLTNTVIIFPAISLIFIPITIRRRRRGIRNQIDIKKFM